ncbi:C-type lectin-like [Candoia aspera]|uniref:C-type lectin-like n=1 Tax=Candoia aspera TaxID=51853 RepID=UPI002FD84DA2
MIHVALMQANPLATQIQKKGTVPLKSLFFLVLSRLSARVITVGPTWHPFCLAESLVVANHIMSYQTKPSNVWIGLHDIRHNGKWRWSDESTYNYKAWMLGKPNLGMKEYCVGLVHLVHGANIPKDSYHQFEEIPIGERRDFTKWNNTACHKLNAYICKHEW